MFDWLLSLGEGPIFFVCWNTCVYRCLSVVCVRLKNYFFEKFHSRIIELYFCIENLPSEGVMKFSAGGSFSVLFDILIQRNWESVFLLIIFLNRGFVRREVVAFCDHPLQLRLVNNVWFCGGQRTARPCPAATARQFSLTRTPIRTYACMRTLS